MASPHAALHSVPAVYSAPAMQMGQLGTADHLDAAVVPAVCACTAVSSRIIVKVLVLQGTCCLLQHSSTSCSASGLSPGPSGHGRTTPSLLTASLGLTSEKLVSAALPQVCMKLAPWQHEHEVSALVLDSMT